MAFSLYSATVPTYLQILPALLGLIDKAEAHCQTQGIAPRELLEAQLAPDMWNFATQIRTVTTHSAGVLEGAIAGENVLQYSAPPTDFAGLRTLIKDAIARVKAVTPEQIDALVGRDAVFRFGEMRMDFTAEDFLLSFALPNFSFHASVAYCILRMKGVAVGKRDFLGAIRMKASVPA
jgi:hypothetical protein